MSRGDERVVEPRRRHPVRDGLSDCTQRDARDVGRQRAPGRPVRARARGSHRARIRRGRARALAAVARDRHWRGARGARPAGAARSAAAVRVGRAGAARARLAARQGRPRSAVGLLGCGRQPLARARRTLSPAVPPDCRSHRLGDRQRARPRRRAPPGGSARGDRSRQDRLLLQRQPRVPHAAHVDARSARRCARQPGRRPRGREPARGAQERAAAAQAGQCPARLRAHRSRARPGVLRARGSRRRDGGPGERVSLGDGARRAALRGRLPEARSAGLCRSRHVGEARREPAVECVQVHVRGHGPRPVARARRPRRAHRRGYRRGRRRARAAAPDRPLPPRRRHTRAHVRGLGHRALARARDREAARRHA